MKIISCVAFGRGNLQIQSAIVYKTTSTKSWWSVHFILHPFLSSGGEADSDDRCLWGDLGGRKGTNWGEELRWNEVSRCDFLIVMVGKWTAKWKDFSHFAETAPGQHCWWTFLGVFQVSGWWGVCCTSGNVL